MVESCFSRWDLGVVDSNYALAHQGEVVGSCFAALEAPMLMPQWADELARPLAGSKLAPVLLSEEVVESCCAVLEAQEFAPQSMLIPGWAHRLAG